MHSVIWWVSVCMCQYEYKKHSITHTNTAQVQYKCIFNIHLSHVDPKNTHFFPRENRSARSMSQSLPVFQLPNGPILSFHPFYLTEKKITPGLDKVLQ